MFKLRYLLLVKCVVLTCSLQVFNVYADCSYDANENYSKAFNNIIVQRDASVGTEIASVAMGNGAYTRSDGTCKTNVVMTYNGPKPTSLENVFETNIPGVGISLSFSDNAGNYYASISPGTIAHGGKIYELGAWYTYDAVIHLIKTGPITSGSLMAEEVGHVLLTSTNGTLYDSQKFNLAGGTVTQVACAITTPQLTFNIGNLLADKVGTEVGTVPEDSKVTQNLGLECDAEANINVSLSGTQNPDVTTESVLALTGQGSEGTAKGVGVQLLYNNTPLELNKRIVLKKSTGGQEAFPLVARYYQTQTTVMPGKANASATLNITYQ